MYSPPSSDSESESSLSSGNHTGQASTQASASDPQLADSSAGAPASTPSGSARTLGALKEPHRLHPLTLLLRVGASIPPLLLILLPTLQNPSTENLFSVLIAVFYGVVALPAIILQYVRFSYRITPKQIVIQKGVLKRQNRSIPIERVQNIQIERNMVARIFGVAKVQIETAGSSATEGSLEYVGLKDAHDIRQVVRSFQQRSTQDQTRDETVEGEDAEPDSTRLYSLGLPRVLLSGAFRFSLLYIALIFSAFQLVDPQTIVQRVLRTQGRIDQITETMAAHPGFTILATVVVAVFFGWISGILIHLARYYNFELWLDGNKLRKRHGLFTVTEGTIPLKKVQVLILRTNPFMRIFGWCELAVQTVGMNVNEQGHRVIAPFAQFEQALDLGTEIRSFELPDSFDSVSPVTIRRRFIRYSVALGVVILPALYFWPAHWWKLGGVALPWWGFVLIPFLLGWAVLQYRNHEYGARKDGLYIRRGVITHYLWIIPVEKFHVFHNAASIFQRRLDLKTFFVDTAGAATFAYPEVIDLPAEEADLLVDNLYERFQTLYRTRIEERTGDPKTRLDAEERPRLPADERGRGVQA